MPSKEDLLWIERFYSDFETGHTALGKVYIRPKNYIERAMKVINASKRNKLLHQFEGKKSFFHEDN